MYNTIDNTQNSQYNKFVSEAFVPGDVQRNQQTPQKPYKLDKYGRASPSKERDPSNGRGSKESLGRGSGGNSQRKLKSSQG